MTGLRDVRWAWLGSFVVAACGGSSSTASSANAPTSETSVTTVDASGARVVSLAVAADSLTADKVGDRDGAFFPDGIRDVAFDVELFGPVTAIYLLTVDERGDPNGIYRVNTLVGESEPPPSLGGTLEKGRFTACLGVFEDGKLVNKDDGSLAPLPAGRHILKLYTTNPGSLHPGLHLRLFAELPDRSIIKGPVITLP